MVFAALLAAHHGYDRVTTAKLSGGSSVSATRALSSTAFRDSLNSTTSRQVPHLTHKPSLIVTGHMTGSAEKHLTHPGKELLKTEVGRLSTCHFLSKYLQKGMEPHENINSPLKTTAHHEQLFMAQMPFLTFKE